MLSFMPLFHQKGKYAKGIQNLFWHYVELRYIYDNRNNNNKKKTKIQFSVYWKGKQAKNCYKCFPGKHHSLHIYFLLLINVCYS